MDKLKELLTKTEFTVYQLMIAGKSNKEISEITKRSPGSIRVHKTKIQKKLGNVNTFAHVKSPGAEHAQIQKNDLKFILSPLELKIFLELEKSQKNYQLVADIIGTTELTVRNAIRRIKQKIGPDFSRLFERKIESEQERPCNQRKFHERDVLLDRLNDSGFLKLMFQRYALGVEPDCSDNMLKLGVNHVGCQDYLFKKRAQQLFTMVQSARYPVVLLTKQDLQKNSYVEEYIDEETLKSKKRTRYPIREFLKHHRVKCLKTEYEESQEYTSYYVFKNIKLYQQLMEVLFQETEISMPEEGTLRVTFHKEVFIAKAYLEKEGQREQIEIDKRSSRIHNIAANYSHGEYKLILVIGESKNYSFNLVYKLNIEGNNYCSILQIA